MNLFRQAMDYAQRADPYPLYARLRATPIARQEDGTYVVSTYRELSALLHDPRMSSDERKSTGRVGPAAYAEDGSPPFLFIDPPDHDRLRRLAMRHFGPPNAPGLVESKRHRLVAMVDELIAVHRDCGQLDIVAGLSTPLPVTVICELLGVPREDESRFHAWSEALAGTLDPMLSEEPDHDLHTGVAHLDLAFYMHELLDERRRHPRDDMLSLLVTDDGPDGTMSEAELIQTAILLLVAGHETTVNLISNGMLTLLRHPEVLRRLQEQPSLIMGLVEELLRYDPPVQFRTRTTLTELTMAGTTIPQGAPVVLLLAAGNRDPEQFPDPDRFDPDRTGNQHLGFGLGIHYCFGAALARLEGQIALSALVRRLEAPRLVVDPPPYLRNPALRGPRQLLVAFDRIRD